MKKLIVTVVFLLGLVGGCGTMIGGTNKLVSITSSPSEAKFIVSDPKGIPITNGITPTQIMLKRGGGWFKASDYLISFEKEGYTPVTRKLTYGLNGWICADIFWDWGLVSWLIIDASTGGMWDIQDVYQQLCPLGVSQKIYQ